MPHTSQFTTAAGLEVSVTVTNISVTTALDSVFGLIDHKKGAIFSSGFDYPGRHSRWDIGFTDPAIEFIAKAHRFQFSGLNAQGKSIIELIAPALTGHQHLGDLQIRPGSIEGEIRTSAAHFSEEERSRQPSIFSVLRAVTRLFQSTAPEASHFGLYGAFGYDLIHQFEQIALRLRRTGDEKDCHLYLPLELIVVDRKREVASQINYSISTAAGEIGDLPGGGAFFKMPPPNGSAEVTCDHAPGEFADKVRRVIAGTRQGDYFEVVLSQSFSTRFDGRPTDLFRRMASINPSPYMFLLNLGDEQLVGASPELFARVSGRRYETCPIAGTVRRGETPLEDADRVRQLIGSEKEEAELTMCTDVDRNDMARVCVPGTVRVIGRRQLEFYSHLIHTVDHLEGTLAENFDALDAFQTHMWACTVTGAPKPAAVQEIEQLENSPRGWYSGAIGFLCFDGGLNTGITLRTARLKDGRAETRAGATLLFGSDPDSEEQETRTKAASFLAAIARTEETQAKAGEAAAVDSSIAPYVLKKRRKLLLVDCQDSFVHNLAAYLRALNCEVITHRAGFPVELVDTIKPDLILLSPGPATPRHFGVPDLVGYIAGRAIPSFGVCLGHQGIGEHFGAELGTLPVPVHGRPSKIEHYGSPIFKDIESPFEAGRYHSLYIIEATLPPTVEVIARSIDEEGGLSGVPMAVAHRTLPIAGVQFHPESMMTLKKDAGYKLLRNLVEYLAP
jgi:anthranilate synthase